MSLPQTLVCLTVTTVKGLSHNFRLAAATSCDCDDSVRILMMEEQDLYQILITRLVRVPGLQTPFISAENNANAAAKLSNVFCHDINLKIK